jgi:hypothetical protein
MCSELRNPQNAFLLVASVLAPVYKPFSDDFNALDERGERVCGG